MSRATSRKRIACMVTFVVLAVSACVLGESYRRIGVTVPRSQGSGIVRIHAVPTSSGGTLSVGSVVDVAWMMGERKSVNDAQRYLERYMRRAGIVLDVPVIVSVHGIVCSSQEVSAYGRSSYRITYELPIVAVKGNQEVWRGSVWHQAQNTTGERALTEDICALLLREGVNKVVEELRAKEGR